ncbi:hypothetical protein WJX72_005671 [[Myrmecia] bisecta]|uniref:Uncharacterized protein n=1 Tax=[Myrmecia] bisecta TaxID=41462 RepID=A0AAW1QQS6_9CHLO
MPKSKGKIAKPKVDVTFLVACLSGAGADPKTGLEPLSKEQSAATLWSLAVEEGNRALLLKEGAVPALVAVLAKGPNDAKHAAVGCLHHLALAGPEAKQEMHGQKLLPVLLGFYDASRASRHSAAQTEAMADQRMECMAEAGAIPLLIEKLPHDQMPVQDAALFAAGCLWKLSRQERYRHGLSGAVRQLAVLLQEEHPQARAWTAGALWMLSLHDQYKPLIRAADVVAPLVKVLELWGKGKLKDPDLAFHAQGTLRNLCDNAAGLSVVLEAKPPQHLAVTWQYKPSCLATSAVSKRSVPPLSLLPVQG